MFDAAASSWRDDFIIGVALGLGAALGYVATVGLINFIVLLTGN